MELRESKKGERVEREVMSTKTRMGDERRGYGDASGNRGGNEGANENNNNSNSGGRVRDAIWKGRSPGSQRGGRERPPVPDASSPSSSSPSSEKTSRLVNILGRFRKE